MRGDLAGSESLGGQRQYDLVDTGQPSLALLDDHRIEGAVGVAGHFDLDRADLGEHRLGPSPIAGIARPAPNGVVFVIAQVLGHLRIQRGFEHVLGQLVEQAVRADQLDALFLRLRQQLLSELPLIHFGNHGFECFGHHQSFPPSSRPACQTKTRSTVIRTVPSWTPTRPRSKARAGL